MNKIIDIEDKQVNEAFLEIQNKFNIKSGDIEPLGLLELEYKIKKGITKQELKKWIIGYYKRIGVIKWVK